MGSDMMAAEDRVRRPSEVRNRHHGVMVTADAAESPQPWPCSLAPSAPATSGGRVPEHNIT